MYRTITLSTRRRNEGQTLIIAIIIMGVLLIIGFIFLGLITQNLRQSGTTQQRSVARDLAEAGVRFAHNQLVYSEQAADWRPSLTPPLTVRDPDANYLRPNPGVAGDLGGPDGLGPFTRVSFDQGRALVRVRYGPSDPNIFRMPPSGQFREPGKLRAYMIIESVGRPGRVNVNDPTTLLNTDRREEKRLIAFASIGIIDHARSFMNKFRETRPAEIGAPAEFGAMYGDVPGAGVSNVTVPVQLGDSITSTGGSTIRMGGTIRSNADIVVHGRVNATLNKTYGDSWEVYGTISGVDAGASVKVTRTIGDDTFTGDDATFTLSNASAPSLNSRNGNFSTLEGILRDGFAEPDASGYPRSVMYQTPPSMLTTDPSTGQNRYRTMARTSGVLLSNGNTGRFGYGRSVYVDNSSDLQMRIDESGRETVGSAESLVYDWLNPNNGATSSGWQGNFYVPRGAYVLMVPDGFYITRDARANTNQRTWRLPDGTRTSVSTILYRLRLLTVNGRQVPYIINSLMPGVNIYTNSDADFRNFGYPFNGVMFFEGNVRIRGVIPTDVQMTIMSLATIYIEGSITKGVVNSAGAILNRPSLSTLMLMAKDYVTINTTQFFGTGPAQALREKQESGSTLNPNPIEIALNDRTSFVTELLLDPNSSNTPTAPNSWTSYAAGYRSADNNQPMNTLLLLSHAADGGGPSYLGVDINLGLAASAYQFYQARYLGGTPGGASAGDNNLINTAGAPAATIVPNGASEIYGGVNNLPLYGLTDPAKQVFPKFESIGFPIVRQGSFTASGASIVATGAEGRYQLVLQRTSEFLFRTQPIGSAPMKAYLLARAAVVPHDVRIEAAMYAEDGSFFVIPGRWFNPNPNDRRDQYDEGTTQAERIQARLRRYETYGSLPEMPFYGEPLDVRVSIVGAISENMPPPMDQQSQWLLKWGWIPRMIGATGIRVPAKHVPSGYSIATDSVFPNLIVTYDPALATARVSGFADTASNPYIRTDEFGRPLPPMPRLPVSPALLYFGEVKS